ncbi:hypothetical protein GCM10027417_00250 [Glutamicibacter endophyticus]
MQNHEYLKNLAYQLRCRRMPESLVAQTLREVHTESEAAQSTPMELFGPEKDYAETFTKGKATSKGFWIISGSAAIAAALILGRVVASIVSASESHPLFSILNLVGALAIVCVGSVIGALVNHRLPEGVI